MIKTNDMAAINKRKAGPIIPSSIDIQVECQALSYDDLSKAPNGEPSSSIRERVLKALRFRNTGSKGRRVYIAMPR